MSAECNICQQVGCVEASHDDIYSKARDVVAGLLDGMGFDEEAYGAADHLIGKLGTAGYMVWPKREDWKRLDELEADVDILRAAVTDLGDTAADVLARGYMDDYARTMLLGVVDRANTILDGTKVGTSE